jgi:metallothiol transferase
MSENDQEAFIKHLEENEIEYTRGRSRNIREGKSVYVRDYDGHLLEFHSRTRTDRLELYKDERHDIEIL